MSSRKARPFLAAAVHSAARIHYASTALHFTQRLSRSVERRVVAQSSLDEPHRPSSRQALSGDECKGPPHNIGFADRASAT